MSIFKLKRKLRDEGEPFGNRHPQTLSQWIIRERTDKDGQDGLLPNTKRGENFTKEIIGTKFTGNF